MAAVVVDTFISEVLPVNQEQFQPHPARLDGELSVSTDLKDQTDSVDSDEDCLIVKRHSKSNKRTILKDLDGETEDELKEVSKKSLDIDSESDIGDSNLKNRKTKIQKKSRKALVDDDSDGSDVEDRHNQKTNNEGDTSYCSYNRSSVSERKTSSRQKEKLERSAQLQERLKKYRTRSKEQNVGEEPMAADNEGKEEEGDSLAIFQNRDLFSADESENDDELVNEADDSAEIPDDITLATDKLLKPKSKEGVHRVTVKDKIKTKSEQQRLLRNQPLKIKCHQPEPPSLDDFLKRVPSVGKQKADSLKIQKKSEHEKRNGHTQEIVPRLQRTNDEIIFEDDDVSCHGKVASNVKKPSKIRDFFQCLNKPKEADSKGKETLDSNTSAVTKATSVKNLNELSTKSSPLNTTEWAPARRGVIDVERINQEAKLRKTPGSRLLILKDQLIKGMRAAREETRKVEEIQRREYDEELSEEDIEESGTSDEDNSGDDDDDDLNSKVYPNEETINVVDGGQNHTSLSNGEEAETSNVEDNESDDEELKKWNADDAFKQLENEVEKSFVEDDTLQGVSFNETVNSAVKITETSNELFSGANDSGSADPSNFDDGQSLHLELKPGIEWEDSNTMQLGQGEPSKTRNPSAEFNTPFTKLFRSGLLGSTSKSSPSEQASRSSRNADNTQDGSNEESENSEAESSINNFHLALDEDTQFTQILDTQGYLNPRKGAKKRQVKRLFDTNDSNTMADAAELCSGGFSGTTGGNISPFKDFKLPNPFRPSTSTVKKASEEMAKLFDSTQVNSASDALDFCSGRFEDTANQNTKLKEFKLPSGFQTSENGQGEEVPQELLNLCSGKFQETKTDIDSRRKGSKIFQLLDDGCQDGEQEVLDFCSGKFTSQQDGVNKTRVKVQNQSNYQKVNHQLTAGKRKASHNLFGFGSDEEDNDNESDYNYPKEQREGPSFDPADDVFDVTDADNNETIPTGKVFDKKNFYEEEAELSGSDIDSGDEDLGSEYDEYEEESDVEDLPSEEELWDQVKKVHMKEVLDEDKRRLRRYQEMYLEDGDLHSDGMGRRRNFRWRNIDENSQVDMFSRGGGSDGEYDVISEELSQQEMQRKIERFERDTFLMEQRKEEQTCPMDDDSQSILNLIRDTSNLNTPDEVESSQPAKVKPSVVISKPLLKKSGSFLGRNSSSLQRLSSATSGSRKQISSGRAVVFQSRSPEDKEGSSKQESKLVKNFGRSNSVSDIPCAKRRRLDERPSLSQGQSVFAHL